MGLELRADGTAVQVIPMPPLDGITIDNRLTLDDRDCRRWDDENGDDAQGSGRGGASPRGGRWAEVG